MKTALLLSGGMDSIAIAWWRRSEIDLAFTVDYGQLAAQAEIAASAQVCRELSIPHQVIRVDCRTLGAGDMAGVCAHTAGPSTDWWPYRNQLLITLVAMQSLSAGVRTILIGTVASDASHQDGTREFVATIDRLLKCQEGGLSVEAPAIALSTAELIRVSGVPLDLLAWAHSCHTGNTSCGQCRGCNKYLNVYESIGHELERPWNP